MLNTATRGVNSSCALLGPCASDSTRLLDILRSHVAASGPRFPEGIIGLRAAAMCSERQTCRSFSAQLPRNDQKRCADGQRDSSQYQARLSSAQQPEYRVETRPDPELGERVEARVEAPVPGARCEQNR